MTMHFVGGGLGTLSPLCADVMDWICGFLAPSRAMIVPNNSGWSCRLCNTPRKINYSKRDDEPFPGELNCTCDERWMARLNPYCVHAELSPMAILLFKVRTDALAWLAEMSGATHTNEGLARADWLLKWMPTAQMVIAELRAKREHRLATRRCKGTAKSGGQCKILACSDLAAARTIRDTGYCTYHAPRARIAWDASPSS